MRKIYFALILFNIPLISLLAQIADKITVVDTRDVNSAPNTYNKEVKFEFKHRSTIGVPGSGGYSGNMTFAPWADNTGDKSHQLNFNEGGIYYRTGEPDATSWEAWGQLIIGDQDGNLGNLNIHEQYTGSLSLGSNDNVAVGTNFGELNFFHGGSYNTNLAKIAATRTHLDGNAQIAFLTASQSVLTQKMVIKNDGKVGIGTTSPYYKLDVEGTIRAHEIKVNLDEGADFVFEEDYNLMPLKELEAFVKTQKHLPEVAPAKEMEAEGLSISEMNIKLLQKIEELTLYTIEQEKTIEKLLEKGQRQDAIVKELIMRIENLENIK